MIKVVFFDYGGVMKDSHPLRMDVPKMLGLSDKELEDTKEEREKLNVLGEKGLISDQEYWQRLSKIIGRSIPGNPEKVAKELYRKTFIFKQEMFDLAKNLRDQGIKTGILSDVYKFNADVIREKNGYDGFEPIVLSYEVGMMKPDADIYSFAVKKIGVKPEECIFIDDKERNMPPAKELGIKTVLFKNPKQTIKEVFDIISKEK